MFLWLTLIFLLPGPLHAQTLVNGIVVPATLSNARLVIDAKGLEAAFNAGVSEILLKQGTYAVNNPVVFANDRRVALYGAGRMKTKLVPKNPVAPLFIAKDAKQLILSGLSLVGSIAKPTGVLVRIEGSVLSPVLIQDVFFHYGALDISGPANVLVQGTHFEGDSISSSPKTPFGIFLNHSGASLVVVGGNMSGHKIAHVLQAQGHLQMYGTGFQHSGAAPVGADVVLSSPSLGQAHVLAAIRSEGTNSKEASTFLRVPASPSSIDVILKANNFTSPSYLSNEQTTCGSTVGTNVFVDYNANGNIWLLGNYGDRNVTSLVQATNSQGNVVAFGNAVKGCLNSAAPKQSLFQVPASLHVTEANNLFDIKNSSAGEVSTYPQSRFVTPTAGFAGLASFPMIPDVPSTGVIPIATRPVFNMVASNNPLRDATAFRDSNLCKAAKDDTCFLQLALRTVGANLYIPPGVYKTSSPLELNQRGSEVGGLIAGGGSRVTRISCACGTVFKSDGLGFVTMQGLSLEALSKGGQGVLTLEWPEKILSSRNPYFATQGNNFYDIEIRGGKYGAAIGTLSQRQCSENLFVDSKFVEAGVGVAIGSYNALSNLIADSTFSQTDWNIGFSDERSGGSWVVLHAKAVGTRLGVLYKPSLSRALYHFAFESDGPQLLNIGWNANETSIVFDHSIFTSTAPEKEFVNFNAGQGLTFLRSDTGGRKISVNGSGAVSFVHVIYGDRAIRGPSKVDWCGEINVSVPINRWSACNTRIGYMPSSP